jgi:hypothetical protein
MSYSKEDKCLETNLNRHHTLETMVNLSKDQREAAERGAGNSTPWGNDPKDLLSKSCTNKVVHLGNGINPDEQQKYHRVKATSGP